METDRTPLQDVSDSHAKGSGVEVGQSQLKRKKNAWQKKGTSGKIAKVSEKGADRESMKSIKGDDQVIRDETQGPTVLMCRDHEVGRETTEKPVQG